MTTKSMSAAFLAIAGAVAFFPSSSSAAIVYSDGDLILGFRATGGQGASTDYLIDIGPASSFVNGSGPLNLSIGNIGTDLTNIFGSGWATRGDVFWSISGVQKVGGNGFVTNTMFATRSDTISAPLGTATTTPWTRPSSFAAGTPTGKIQSAGQKYGVGTTGATAADQIESTNAPGALIQPTGQSNSFASFQPFGLNTNGASAYSYFVDANGIESSFANGAGAAVLDLYQLTPGAGNLPATFVGNFAINESAVVAFAPSVPEPTAGLSLLLGGAVLGAFRRRNRSRAVNS